MAGKASIDKLLSVVDQRTSLAIESGGGDEESTAGIALREVLKPGPRKTDITPAMIEILARINCSKEDIAFAFGVNIKTIERRFHDPEFELAYIRGRAKGRIRLRMLQQKLANSSHGSAVNMAIHLSKHILGETDKQSLELTGKDGGPVALTFTQALKELDNDKSPLIDVTPTKSELLPERK